MISILATNIVNHLHHAGDDRQVDLFAQSIAPSAYLATISPAWCLSPFDDDGGADPGAALPEVIPILEERALS
ncbi:MAG: hypothetical protein GY769_07640 [bacterium]|nr:hypothetical protein [bacterium]